jgi:hypothetical protein
MALDLSQSLCLATVCQFQYTVASVTEKVKLLNMSSLGKMAEKKSSS